MIIKGDICVNTLKKDWTPEITISHILQVIRCLLINPFPESSLNDEAGKLFLDSYEEYAARAQLITKVHAIAEKAESLNTTEELSSETLKENALKKKEKETKKKNLKRL